MAVYLRKQKLAKGRQSYYLDIWDDSKRHYEFLKLYTTRARTPEEQAINERTKALAESIRNKRDEELKNSDHGFIPKFKQNTDFVAFFEKFYKEYKGKDVRLVKASLKYFKEYLKEKGFDYLAAKNLNEKECKDFKAFLEGKVHGETIYNYFTKFKTVIKAAVEEDILRIDVAKKVKNSKTEGLKKDILSIDEINKLAAARCGNEEVKRAFLFSLNTGLRWCDVNELKWKNIDNNKLRFTQQKVEHISTNAINNIDLNINALRMIGQRGKPEEKIFNLPSHTGCLKSLENWVKTAKIDKHITWHCARHSFAVNLLDKEVGNADVKTVAALLGHSDLDNVNKYLRVVEEKKKQAVNGLPVMNI